MARSYEELPEEIWELILNRLDDDHHSHFQSLSLVSKRFLSLTDRLRLRFAVVDQTYLIHGTISPIIYRFKHLKTLDLSRLSCFGTVETALHEIARSSVAFNLEALDISNQESVPIKGLKELGLRNRKLKVLKCKNLIKLCDEDLIAIAEFQPCLEELDISSPSHEFTIDEFFGSNPSELVVTDAGIEFLSSHLKNLAKINISRNHFVTDRSIVALSSNCLCLREILFSDCSFITKYGVQFLLQNSPNLTAVCLCVIPQSPRGILSLFMDLAISSRGLCSLDFRGSHISNEFLHSIAKARVPLKRVSLSCCVGYSVDGISSFLNSYQSLEFLDLSKNNSLSDQSFAGLSKYLCALVSIKLNCCSKLTSASLFTLINDCPFLKDTEMTKTNMGKEESVMNVVKNPNSNIKTLNLAGNVHLSDECLTKITSVCPNLELLDVSSCSGITAAAVCETLKHCSEIRHLSIQDCGGVENLGLSIKLPKLENLFMARSGLNDEGLMKISKSCSGLVKIALGGCLHITIISVNEITRSCKSLREIDLTGCPNLNSLVADWMVYTRPSLRKIILPSYVSVTESQRKFLLCHGCQVCEKSDC